jgi:predicted ATPase/DNA-binding winged helix-turn-helix (wHTH) protein
MQPVRYQFGRFALDPVSRVLLIDGHETAVTPRAFDLLLALAERAGQLISKNELLELVWPKLVVEENNLQVQVSVLRKLLGAEVIATVPGRGYKLTLLPSGAAPSGRTAHVPEARGTSQTQGNLPAQFPALFGRSDDVASLTHLVERHRVVSVVGPAGIGKTRVAQAVAHASCASHADGVWLVELAPLSDPNLVALTVARVLGHVIAQTDAAPDALAQAVRQHQLLLVLDNCEHLAGAVAALVTKIVAHAPGVRVLVTSQEPLHVAEEQVDRLRALAVPPTADAASALRYGAVELFVARAQAADPRFALSSQNVSDVVEICRRLDGIPLALELAAARLPLLGVHGVRERLDERVNLLAGGTRAALPRHQTLRAALQWSYALLSAAEQTVFDRLGVFVGTFSLEAAQLVAADASIDAWAVLDHLATLVDKSLMLVEGGDLPRYRLLESSRAFALERLAADGTLEAMRRIHAQSITDSLIGRDEMEEPKARMRRIGPDLDNVRAAVAWATGPTGSRQIAVALAAATDKLWAAHGFNQEGDRLYRKIESLVDDSIPMRDAARFWFAVSDIGLLVGLRRLLDAARKAADLFRALGDRYWLYRALLSAAAKLSLLGDAVAAEAPRSEAKELLDSAWPLWVNASLDVSIGFHEFFALQRPHDARRHAEAVLARRPELGDCSAIDGSELLILFCGTALGEYSAVERKCREFLSRPDTGIVAYNKTFYLSGFGKALTALGDLDQGEAMLRAALERAQRAAGSASWLCSHLAFHTACRGRFEDAARLLGFIDAIRTTDTLAHPPTEQRSYDDALDLIQSALGPEKVERLRIEGRALSEAQAIALAFPDAQSDR